MPIKLSPQQKRLEYPVYYDIMDLYPTSISAILDPLIKVFLRIALGKSHLKSKLSSATISNYVLVSISFGLGSDILGPILSSSVISSTWFLNLLASLKFHR